MSEYTILKLRNVPDKRRSIRRGWPGKRIYISELSGITVNFAKQKKTKKSVGQRRHIDLPDKNSCYSNLG